MWRLAEDTISNADLMALANWLGGSPQLTQGPLVRAFEQKWSEWLGVHDSVMVTSGTAANFLLITVVARRLGRSRPRVGVSSVTWSTNVTPSLLLGHELVVFDVDPKTLGVNSGAVSRAMREDQIDVLFVTHLLGLNALTAEMVDAAERSGVVLLEDCCEAHGTRFGSRKVGTYGFGSTFSFYFGHHMSTIEGGMISTNDPGLADELRIMRAHGLARESARFHLHKKDHPQISPDFLFIEPGLNFRSTEINAFLGLRQLEKLDERIQIRNLNMQAFLDSAPEFLWTDFSTEGISSFALPLISRDRESYKRVSETLARLSIEKRPVVAGNLIYQPFMKEAHVRVYDGVTPIADHIHTHGLYVGNGHHVDQGMVRKMTAALA